jgi:hypothetical protein
MVIPVFFRFNPHAQMEMSVEAYDEAAVEKWLDDRIVEFAEAYLELHSTKQYQERVLVSDPVAGISRIWPRRPSITTGRPTTSSARRRAASSRSGMA